MTVQAVRPAGAGHETGIVLAVCAVIILLASLTIILRATVATDSSIDTNQVDARRGLTAAEQGIYADLLVAADEIAFADTPPAVSDLAQQMIPPFAVDSSTIRRGQHDWQMKQDSTAVVYIGVSHDPQTAGSLLLRLPLSAESGHVHEQSHEPVQVWLHKSADNQAQLPQGLDQAALIHDGWKQIVSQFDAGATRHQP